MVRKCSVVIPDGPPAAPLRDVRRLRVKKSSSAFPGLHDSEITSASHLQSHTSRANSSTRFFFWTERNRNVVTQSKEQTLTTVSQSRRGGNPPLHRTCWASLHPHHKRFETPAERRQMPVKQRKRAMTTIPFTKPVQLGGATLGSDLARAPARTLSAFHQTTGPPPLPQR